MDKAVKSRSRGAQQDPIAEISLKSVAFRDFTFDFRTGELWRKSRLIHLRPRASRALALLLARPGELVGQEALRTAIWGESIVEWQAGLHQIIRELRAALDDGEEHAVIETVSRRGYRFRPRVRAVRSQARWNIVRLSAREVAFLGAGAMLFPLLFLAACITIGAVG